MGYCMTRRDDVRLVGEGSIETRRESFCLRWDRMSVRVLDGPTMEIHYRDVARLRTLLDVAMAHGADEGDCLVPTVERLRRWEREESDAKLVDLTETLTDSDLRRAIELREKLK